MLSHTQRDCAKNQRIASLASKQMTEYWNTWYKPSRTANSLKEAFRRNGTSINSLRKQAKEKISISKSKTRKKISRYWKWGISLRILQRAASGTEEEIRRRNRRNLRENETTRKKRKRKAKAVVTVERQERTLQSETAQHTDNTV